MAINLKLGDRLAIIKDGVNKGLTPQLAILQYQVNKDGGYNAWKNTFKKATGIDPDLDNTYNYELFFNENPEAAKLLVLGKISPEILLMYKTPEAIQKEKQVLLLRQKGNINSLMDYSLYEKQINDYMNKSVSTPMYAAGGPISINMYANGTSELATADNPNVTEIGMIPEKWSRSIAPDFIEVTPEELQYFKRATMNVPDAVYSDESVPLEYKDVASKHTKWVSVPWDYIEEKSPNSRRSKGSTHAAYYMLEDVDENNPKKYYRLYRVRESSPEGRAYEYWKRQQAYEDRQSREYEYNYGDGEWLNIGTSEVLPQVTVTYNPETKNYVEEPQEEIITSENTSKPIADSIPISETSPYAQGNSETSYYNPFNAPDGELNVPNNNPYGTEGVSGGSSFGSGTEGIKMPDIFDMNIQDIPYEDLLFEPYQWQLEDLEYLNPPGYVPIPNWDVSLVYDSGEGVDFADFMMKLAGYGSRNNTRDLLMQQLMQPKDYFADPYAGNNYNDARSFYDAYNNDPFTKIQRESNGIPLYATGGRINLFDGTHGSGYVSRALKPNQYSDFAEIDGLKVVRINPSVFLSYWPDVYSWYPLSAANRDFLGYITPLGVMPIGANSYLSKAIDKYNSQLKMLSKIDDFNQRALDIANDIEVARGAQEGDYDVVFYDNVGVLDPSTGKPLIMYLKIPYEELWNQAGGRDEAARRAYEMDIAKGNTSRSTFRPAPGVNPDYGDTFGVLLPSITVGSDTHRIGIENPPMLDENGNIIGYQSVNNKPLTGNAAYTYLSDVNGEIFDRLSHEAAILRGRAIDKWIENLNIQDNPGQAAKLGAQAAALGALTYLTGGMGNALITNPVTTMTALAAFGAGSDIVNSISAGINPTDFASSGLRWEDIPLDRRGKTWDETASDILEPLIGRGLADLVGPLTNIGGLTHAGLLSQLARPVDKMILKGVRNGVDAFREKVDTYRLAKEMNNTAETANIGNYVKIGESNPNYRYVGPSYNYNGVEIPVDNRTSNLSNILFNKTGEVNKESATGGIGRTLTLDAVKDFTDKDWDNAYFDAINKGDMISALNIRDLHHATVFNDNLLVNNNGMPTHYYHISPNKFDTFDIGKIGSTTDSAFFGKGFYSAPNRNYGNIQNILGFRGKNNDKITYDLYGYSKRPFRTLNDSTRENASEYFNTTLEDWKNIFNPYENVNNDNYFNNSFIKHFNKVRNRFGSELTDADGVIVSRGDLLDKNNIYVTAAKEKYGDDIYDELVLPKPEQHKLADAITYDENGNVIPISKRDDINNPSFLYTKMGEIDKESLRAGMQRLLESVRKAYKHLSKGYSEDIARANKMITDIDANKSTMNNGVYGLYNDLYGKEHEQEKIVNDYFRNNPTYQEVSVLDIAGNVENMAKDPFYLEWKLGMKNGLPYELKYNNSTGNFEITSKQLAGPSKYQIPRFGTDEWETGQIDLINYFNKDSKSGKLEIEPASSQGVSMTYFGTPPKEIWKRINNDYSGKPKYFFENGRLVENPEITFNENPNQATTTAMFENAPLMPESLLKIIADNIAYVEKEIPGFKALGSSVSAREETAARAPGDIDGYIAKSDFDKLPLNMKNRMTTDNGNTYQYQLDESGRRKYIKKDSQGNILYNRKKKPDDWGIIDVNIVEIDRDGFGNSRAEQLYRLFYPEQYHKAVIEAYSNPNNRGRIRMLDENGKVLTDTQLVLKYNPVVASIMDAMEANFLDNPTYKDKHAGRWYNYMVGNRPDVVSEALSLVTKMAFGEKGYKLPKLKFGTPKENEELLVELGYPKEAAHIIAKDEAKMLNALDYWFISDRTSYRATGPGNMGDVIGTPQTITRNLTKWDVNAGGGTNWGGGLNSTLQGKSEHSGLVGRVQFNIKGLKEGMTPKEAIDKIDYQMGISPITQADIDVLNAMGISHNLNVGDPVSELHAVLSPLKIASGWRHGDEPIYNEFLEKSGRRGITSRGYGQGLYFGEGPIDPSVDALGVSNNNYDIMGVKNRKEFIESYTGVDPSATTKRIMYDASYLEANSKFLNEVQKFRANSQEILDIDKEILGIRKEIDKITNAGAAGFKAKLRLEELKNKYERLERKRKHDLKKLKKIGIGGITALIVGLGGGGLYSNAKEKREELRKQNKYIFTQDKKIIPTFGTSTIEGNQELYEIQ